METPYLFLSARYAYRKLPDVEAANHSFTSNLKQSKGRQDDKIDIKWEESFIDFGESDLTEDILKKHL